MAFKEDCVRNLQDQFSCADKFFREMIEIGVKQGWNPTDPRLKDPPIHEWQYALYMNFADAESLQKCLQDFLIIENLEGYAVSKKLIEEFIGFLSRGAFEFAYDD